MFYYDKPMPDEGEIVALRVDELQEYGVAVTLLEYEVKGMIFAQELSKRRIRSMKDVVRVGQETAATITRVDPVNKSVDLSLRVCSPEEIVKVLDDYGKHKAVYNLVKRVASQVTADMYQGQARPLCFTDPCAICANELGQAEVVQCGRDCRQYYHTACMDQLKRHNRQENKKTTCPSCRAIWTTFPPDIRDLFEHVVWPLSREGRDVYDAFVSVNDPTVDPTSVLGSDHPYVDLFKSVIADRFPKPTFTATHDQRLVCTDCLNAPEKLTAALNAVAKSGIQVWVIAPPMYRFVATDINEPAAKKRIDEACALAQSMIV